MANTRPNASQITFSHNDTPPAGTAGARFKERVSVKDAPFNAKGDGVTNDTAAIQAAIDFVEAAGGGTVYLPAGNYIVNKNTLLHDQSGISFSLCGDGPKASVITCGDATVGFIFKANVPASNTASFA